MNDDPIMEDREDTPTKKVTKSTDDRYDMANERDDGSVHTETPVEPSLSTVREEPSKEEAEEKAADNKDDEPSPSVPVRQVSGQDTETHSMSGESLTLDDTVQSNIQVCNSPTAACSSVSALCGAMFGVTELGCKEH